MTTVLLAVGDASGDAYAADFVRALRARVPDTRFLGLGGVEMEKAGVELVVHQRQLAAGGLVELLPDLPRIMGVWRTLVRALHTSHPDLVVLVDSSGFNIPFAGRAKRSGAQTLYYVSPQIWAWRRGRIRKIARRVDHVAVIHPFEADFYADSGVPVTFVGHPLVERLRRSSGGMDKRSARSALGFDVDAPLVALLPGSRRAELRHILGVHLETARVLHRRVPNLHFALPLAPSLERRWVEKRVRAAALPPGLIQLIEGRSLEVLRACDVALVKPGTATLEAALLGTPIVVAARGNAVTAALLRRLLKVDFLAMPNLIAGAPIVEEFLQAGARPDRISDAVLALFEGPAREAQLAGLARVRDAVGGGRAADRAAQIAEGMIVARAAP